MKPIDIIKIKQAIKEGQLTIYVKEGNIYLKSDIGEVVKIGEVREGD